jgi:chromate reductase, NAD(P)H dehydrogenase (quinone)
MKDERIHVLGIAGSLRRLSYNRGLLRAAEELAPESMELEVFDIAPIPVYDGDVEEQGDPEPVRELKERIRQADALLIATPEYNHSIPGVLKNALDWASRPPQRVLAGKPVPRRRCGRSLSIPSRLSLWRPRFWSPTQRRGSTGRAI